MLNVRTDFGAQGNYNPATGSGADDTTAFSNALAAASSSGQMLYVPAGNYKISSAIGSSSYPVRVGARIFGDGCFASVLYMIGTTSGAPGGAKLSLSGQNSIVRDLGFVAVNNIGDLIDVGFSNAPFYSFAEVSGCHFTVYGANDSFVNELYITTLTQSTIERCTFEGYINAVSTFSGTAIFSNASVNNTVVNCRFARLSTGVNVSATQMPSGTQGLLISQNMFLGVNTGINIQSVSGNYTSYISVVNNIIDFCRVTGIAVSESSGSITSNYIGVDANYASASSAMYIYNCSRLCVIGNSMQEYSGSQSGNVSGIGLVSGSKLSVVNANTIVYFNTGIYVDGSCVDCVITSNVGQLIFGQFLSNSSASSVLANNVSGT